MGHSGRLEMSRDAHLAGQRGTTGSHGQLKVRQKEQKGKKEEREKKKEEERMARREHSWVCCE